MPYPPHRFSRASLSRAKRWPTRRAHERDTIHAVVAHFAAAGLRLDDYLAAAVRQPTLYKSAATTLIANIEGVVGHFAPHGLTLPRYLKAALRQPQLFGQKPTTIANNVETFVRHFVDDGFDRERIRGGGT